VGTGLRESLARPCRLIAARRWSVVERPGTTVPTAGRNVP
jgi:hypothetical protein